MADSRKGLSGNSMVIFTERLLPPSGIFAQLDFLPPSGIIAKMPPHTERLIARLKDYCSARGRQAEVARAIDVSPQRINDWLAGRVLPSGEQALALLAFLDLNDTH